METPLSDQESSFSGAEAARQLGTEHESQPAEYQVLKGYKEAENDEALRTRYLRYTDELIQKIEAVKADYVVYLDKSARPVSWLVREFWDEFADPGAAEPQTRFVNIDREEWRDDMGGNGERIDAGYLPQTVIDELHNIFHDPLHPAESQFDGKSILIVDEVRSSGDTLEIAAKLFERAFPKAKVHDTWWMIPSTPLDNGATDVPIWYRADVVTGRGIGNRNQEESLNSPSQRQRKGWRFLSVPLDAPDPRSDQLRAEIKQLHEDVQAGRQRVIPRG